MSQGFAIPEQILAVAGGIDPARVKRVLSVPGPLPVSTTVNVERANQFWLVSGQGYKNATGLGGIQFQIDGAAVGDLGFFFNNTGVHHTIGFQTFKTAVAMGTRTVTLVATNALQSDGNDGYTITLIELEDTGRAIEARSRPPVVTAFPASPEDGQEVYYRTAQTGVIWHFRYDGTLGYWVFLDGLPLRWAPQVAANNASTANAWTQYGGQAITVPVPGRLTVDFQTSWGFTNGTQSKYHRVVIRNSANTAEVYNLPGHDTAWESMPGGVWLPLNQHWEYEVAAGSYHVSFEYYQTGGNLYINNRGGGGATPARIAFVPTRS